MLMSRTPIVYAGSYVLTTADGLGWWTCEHWDHYVIGGPNTRGMSSAMALPDDAVGHGVYAGWVSHLVGGYSPATSLLWTFKGWFEFVGPPAP
jgi:hypothetical protein